MTDLPASSRWFSGVFVLVSSSDAADYAPLYEECVVLVIAERDTDARERVAEVARGAATSYENALGQVICWSLEAVIDVQALHSPPAHGGTVYSRHFRDYASYRRFEPLLDGTIDVH